MANKLILKRSSVASKVPLATDLEPGELAVNLTDQKLYSKKTDGTVILVGSGLGGAGDVQGPASSTNNAVALFDGTSGKLIKNGSILGALATLNTVGTTQIDNSAVTLDKLATAVKPIGAGQTMQAPSRAFGTNYTNTSGRPIAVGVVGQSTAIGFTGIRIFVDSFVVMDQYIYLQANGERLGVFAIVPNNSVYQVQIHTGSMSLSSWVELR